MQYSTSAAPAANLNRYSVRRPNAAEYFLGQEAFVVTHEGREEVVTWRSASCGIVWNQRGGYVQELEGEIKLASGAVDCILAAMEFLALEYAAQNPAPVAAPLVVTLLLIPASLAPRANFCDRFPHRKAEYLEAQREMFRMARDKGLDTEERESMIECLCALLGVNISSRKQLTPEEMIRATRAFAAGAVLPGWELEDAEMLLAA